MQVVISTNHEARRTARKRRRIVQTHERQNRRKVPVSHMPAFLSLSVFFFVQLVWQIRNTSNLENNTECIRLQPSHSTRSSSLITITCPPSSSSLKITDHSFRYASPSLWNNLPASFCQPLAHSSSVTTITLSITSSLFHSRLKTHLFHKFFPP